jgi:hypothetical protein
LPSYAHRYQDAVAIDGTRTSMSRTRTTRRTCPHYTRLSVEDNAAHLRSPHVAVPPGVGCEQTRPPLAPRRATDPTPSRSFAFSC